MWLLKSKKTEISDTDLVLKFREGGDLFFLEELFDRYIHLVYGTCLKYLKQREKSQDAVMDIFEALAEKLKAHEVKYFKSWLYTLTRNHCLMILRKESGIEEESLDLFSQNLPEKLVESGIDFHPFDIDEVPEDRETQLKECISKLKEQQKECVLLFYYQENSYHEIAQKLRIQKDKVKSYIQNGKRNLRNCMDRKNGRR